MDGPGAGTNERTGDSPWAAAAPEPSAATPWQPQRDWEGEPLHISEQPPPLPSRLEVPAEDDDDRPGTHVIVIDMS